MLLGPSARLVVLLDLVRQGVDFLHAQSYHAHPTTLATKRSMASLIGGCGLGGLYLISAATISSGRDLEGHGLASATSAMVVAVMGQRLVKTRKVMPAGLMVSRVVAK